jgi:hypothetical protein
MLAHPAGSGDFGNRDSNPDLDSLFFRTSVLVPAVRSLVEERACRVTRRREINELTMRMGVGAVGGVIDKEPAAAEISGSAREAENDVSPSDQPDPQNAKHAMWEDWGNRIEVWPTVRAVADRAVGRAVARVSADGSEKRSLDQTPVDWPAVDSAWAAHRASRSLRRAWMKEASGASKSAREQEDDEDDDEDAEEDEEVDDVVDRLKNEEDLDPHEQRLLACIVNPGELSINRFFC